MKVEMFAAGQGIVSVSFSGQPAGINAINKSGKWILTRDSRIPLHPAASRHIGREVTHQIHRPDQFAAIFTASV